MDKIQRIVWFCEKCKLANTLSEIERRSLEKNRQINIKCNVCGQRGILKLEDYKSEK